MHTLRERPPREVSLQRSHYPEKAYPHRAACFVLVPPAIYLVLFCALTYPLIASFSTAFFTNAGDGLQNVWNLWWVNQSLTTLGVSPWFTSYLYYPTGVSLLGHTLNLFNGLLSIVLLRAETLIQAHNTIVVFSFVMAGVGAFWLCYRFSEHYWASIVGGCVFTFSEYHFAHADGHLQLVSLEWIPLFALAWYSFLHKPRAWLAIGAAVTLLLVLLCDFYYFAYCVVYALLMAAYEAWLRKDALFLLRGPTWRGFLLFGGLTALTCTPLIFGLLQLNAADPLLGSHEPAQFSTDLLAAVIPGGHWRFAEFTRPFWDASPGNIQESSVDVGVAVAAVLLYCLLRRSSRLVSRAGVWWWILGVFWVVSLGPVLHIWGTPHPRVPMPYAGLQTLFPLLDLSGVPARMMVMVTLAAAVLTSVGFALLFGGSLRSRLIASGLLVVLSVELLPRPIPATLPEVPAYVSALQSIDGPGAVLDLVSGYFEDRPFGSVTGSGIALYYQTIHRRPMAAGYIARVPSSAWAMVLRQKGLVDQAAYATLCRDYGFRYLVLPSTAPPPAALTSARLLLADAPAAADVFDLAPDGTCIPNQSENPTATSAG
jgi:hypothetical protein